MRLMEHNFIENELVILTKQTLDIFLREENPAELIALYTFYYYTAKWQQTNQIRCTTDYVAKGMHWNRNKVIKVKKQLLEFGLIEDVRKVDPETKKVIGYYVKMNYVFKKETLEKSQCTQNPPTGFEDTEASVLKTEGVAFEYTNALSTNNINALSSNISKKESIKKEVDQSISVEQETKTFDEIKNNYTEIKIKAVKHKVDNLEISDSLRKKIFDYLNHRIYSGQPVTVEYLKCFLEKLEKLSSGEEKIKIAIINQTIEKGYKDIYAISENKTENRSWNKKDRSLENTSYDLEQYEKNSTENYESYLSDMTKLL